MLAEVAGHLAQGLQQGQALALEPGIGLVAGAGIDLLGDGARNRDVGPRTGIRAKLIAPPIIEFFHSFHQTDIALLDEVQ